VARAPRPLAPSDKTDQSWSIISFTITKHQLEVLYPPSFGSSAGVQGPELMMMSAMMAAGRMRMTLRVEGPLHGPRGAVPSAAAAQRHQQTSPRRLAGSTFLFLSCYINAEAGWWTHFPKVFFSIFNIFILQLR